MEEITKYARNLTRNRRKIFGVGLTFLFSVFLTWPAVAQAASLYFSPAAGAYEAGKTFNASVYVSSADQAMNAAAGVISFPKDKLEVVSISKSGSIFSLWVQEPSFSNSGGVINFEGIVLNPGFIGSGGKIMTASFKAKSTGQATLNFSSGSILANDGAGTNILKGLGSANYQLSAAPAPAEPVIEKKPPAAAGAPAAPQVLSSTHPDSDKWYSNKNPRFSWILPAGVDGVGIYFSQSPSSNPGPAPSGFFTSKSYENIDDGIWYFHVKFRNSAGWGPITHFRIQIDTQPPAPFIIKFIDGNETENPRPTILFDAVDSLSGIDYYKIKIGEGDFINLTSEKLTSNPYTLPFQLPGKRNILVQAFDKAGNSSVATEEFTIKPLKEPKFTEYPKKLESGAILTVEGESQYPDSQIIVWLQKDKDDPKSFRVESYQDGKFIFKADEKLSDGIYKLWAEVIDARGAKSLPSEKITITVTITAIFRIGTWMISFLAVIVLFLALVILPPFIFLSSRRKLKRLQKKVREAEFALHKAFDLLREDMREQIKMLEKARTKRQLTEEEEKITKRLKKDLDDAEKSVRKEIEGIKKEVK